MTRCSDLVCLLCCYFVALLQGGTKFPGIVITPHSAQTPHQEPSHYKLFEKGGCWVEAPFLCCFSHIVALAVCLGGRVSVVLKDSDPHRLDTHFPYFLYPTGIKLIRLHTRWFAMKRDSYVRNITNLMDDFRTMTVKSSFCSFSLAVSHQCRLIYLEFQFFQ